MFPNKSRGLIRSVPMTICRICTQVKAFTPICPSCRSGLSKRMVREIEDGDNLSIRMAKQLKGIPVTEVRT